MRNKAITSTILTSIQLCIGGLVSAKGKKQGVCKDWEKENSLFTDDMTVHWIIYIDSLRINKFSKVTGYKGNTQKLIMYQQKQN